MSQRNILSSQDLTKAEYNKILDMAIDYLNKGIPETAFDRKVAGTLFFLPSTRTMLGFQSGAIMGGGGWIGTTSEKGLSMEKGETFEDTIKTFSSFADIIVVRHPDDDAAERGAKTSLVPLINAGCGSKEHAMSPLMQLFAWRANSKKSLEGLTVGIYGTPGINRVCKSILPILGYYKMKLLIDDLENFPLPKEVEKSAFDNGLKSLDYGRLDDFISDVDVLMVTRGLQKGIIANFPKEKEELILKKYKPINKGHLKKMKSDAILSMILPRIFEVAKECDSDPRAIYSKRGSYVEICLATMVYLLS